MTRRVHNLHMKSALRYTAILKTYDHFLVPYARPIDPHQGSHEAIERVAYSSHAVILALGACVRLCKARLLHMNMRMVQYLQERVRA